MQINNNSKPCLVETPQGFTVSYNQRFLYSKYNPSKAIIQTIQNLDILPGTLFLCFSPVLNYGIQELSAKLKENCFILCCEKDDTLFDFSLDQTLPLPENCAWLSCGELYSLPTQILQQNNYPFELAQNNGLTNFPPAGTFKRVIRLDFSAGVQFYSDFYNNLYTACVNSIKTFWVNRVTLGKFGLRYSKNFFTNLKKLTETRPITDFIGHIEKPIIVAGAGESSNVLIEQSRLGKFKNRANFFILCVDTVLPSLIKAGIIPDGVFIEEAQQVISKAFIGCLNSGVQIFAGLSSLPQISRQIKPQKISFFTTKYTQSQFLQNLNDLQLLPPLNEPFGSVGLTAVYYALRFRKNNSIPVYTYGLDFSYSAGITHAKGTLAHTSRLFTTNRLQPVQNYKAAFTGQNIFYTTGDVKKLITTPVLQSYANLFRELFSKEENIFKIGDFGLNIGIPVLDKINNMFETSAASTNTAVSKNTSLPISSFSKEQEHAISKFFETEKQQLSQLRDLLSGKTTFPGQELTQKITSIAQNREYLFLNFPDGHRFSTDISFLKRIRTQLEVFLKIF